MGVQHRFRAAWVVVTAVIIALSSLALLLLLKGSLSRELGTQFTRSFYVLEELRGTLRVAIGFSVLVYVTLVSVLLTAVTIYLSHHIAWPLRRLEHFAEELADGDLGFSFHLRRHDQLRDLTGALDEYRAHAARQAHLLHHAAERIERRWADLGAVPAAEHDRETEKLLEFLSGEVELVREHLRPAPPGPAR